jgi:hypothetical protein
MKIPTVFITWAVKLFAPKLTEGKVEDKKKLWQSKTFWSDVVTILVGIVALVDTHVTGGKIVSSEVYGYALAILGAMGIYGRSNATTKIG